jgi:hypothetical protein
MVASTTASRKPARTEGRPLATADEPSFAANANITTSKIPDPTEHCMLEEHHRASFKGHCRGQSTGQRAKAEGKLMQGDVNCQGKEEEHKSVDSAQSLNSFPNHGAMERQLQPLIASIDALTQHVGRIAQAIERFDIGTAAGATPGAQTATLPSQLVMLCSEAPNTPKSGPATASPVFTFTAPPPSTVSRPCCATHKEATAPHSKVTRPPHIPIPKNAAAPKAATSMTNKRIRHPITTQSTYKPPQTSRISRPSSASSNKQSGKPLASSTPPSTRKTVDPPVKPPAPAAPEKQAQPTHLDAFRPIFGQVSTPPVRAKLDFNFAESPFGNYSDEYSPFTLLKKRGSLQLFETSH